MPTPLGHSLAGIAVFLANRGRPGQRTALYALGLVALANLPDIDFLPGYLFGAPRAYHWGPTHSITAAVTVGCAVGAGARLAGTTFAPVFVLATLTYGSHILMDMLLGIHNHPAVGLQVFWPFSLERHMLPWSLFLAAPRVPGRGPLGLLFSSAAFPLFAREVLVMVPTVFAAWLLGRTRTAKTETSPLRAGS